MAPDIQPLRAIADIQVGPDRIELLCEPGAFPTTLEERADLAKLITASNRFMLVGMAIFLASTRDTFFPRAEQAGDFQAWVNAYFGTDMSPAHVHHLVAVGRMLIDIRERSSVARNTGAWASVAATLYPLPFNKLLPITRLAIDRLPAFVEQYGSCLDSASREQVRAMVDEFAPPTVERRKSRKSPAPQMTLFDVMGIAARSAPDVIASVAEAADPDLAQHALQTLLQVTALQVDKGRVSLARRRDLADRFEKAAAYLRTTLE